MVQDAADVMAGRFADERVVVVVKENVLAVFPQALVGMHAGTIVLEDRRTWPTTYCCSKYGFHHLGAQVGWYTSPGVARGVDTVSLAGGNQDPSDLAGEGGARVGPCAAGNRPGVYLRSNPQGGHPVSSRYCLDGKIVPPRSCRDLNSA